jgi:hypothetical protein
VSTYERFAFRLHRDNSPEHAVSLHPSRHDLPTAAKTSDQDSSGGKRILPRLPAQRTKILWGWIAAGVVLAGAAVVYTRTRKAPTVAQSVMSASRER